MVSTRPPTSAGRPPSVNTAASVSGLSPSTGTFSIRPSVMNMPGTTWLTLMPRWASSSRMLSNAAWRPRFEAL